MRTLMLLAALSLGSGLAQKVNVTLNGQAVALDSVTVGGKTYVSLDQLRAALAVPGGANQRVSVEGCVNEWLFNGLWRMRVTKVEPIADPGRGGAPGWGVTVEWRNGTTTTFSLSKTGIEGGTSLALQDGNILANSQGSAWVDAVMKAVPQGAANIYRYSFWLPDGSSPDALKSNLPAKLLVEVKPGQLQNWSETRTLRYPIANPSFRVNLGCSK